MRAHYENLLPTLVTAMARWKVAPGCIIALACYVLKLKKNHFSCAPNGHNKKLPEKLQAKRTFLNFFLQLHTARDQHWEMYNAGLWNNTDRAVIIVYSELHLSGTHITLAHLSTMLDLIPIYGRLNCARILLHLWLIPPHIEVIM